MPTDEQIEAVVRAITEQRSARTGMPRGMFGQPTIDGIRADAIVAITAYEATRPAVATDEELLEAFRRASYRGTHGTTDQHILAGIRAVKRALLGAEAEKGNTAEQRDQCPNCNGTGKARRWMPDEPAPILAPCLWCDGTGLRGRRGSDG